MSADGYTPEQRLALERQERRNAAITKLVVSLKGRKDTREVGDFAKRSQRKSR
jgi:hypothetical protein